MLTFVCTKCLTKIADFGFPVHHLYYCLIDLMTQDEDFIEIDTETLDPTLEKMFKFLEEKGIIVSTEISEKEIKIKPAGLKILQNNNLEICVCDKLKDSIAYKCDFE